VAVHHQLSRDINLDVGTFYDASAGHPPAFAALKADADADIVIIGGGFAGLGTALSLLERGQRAPRSSWRHGQ
jgi:hypothetical protein